MDDSRILTTLCYIEKDNQYLMMHRVSKKNDLNEGKWIGVGGHFKPGESPEECLLREVKEETGLRLTSYKLRGIITFVLDGWGYEYMHLYTADAFEGTLGTKEMKTCTEGVLEWVDKDKVLDLNLWEGDKIFLKLLLEHKGMFSLKLEYHEDTLVHSAVQLYD